jgi:hypothetical protein
VPALLRCQGYFAKTCAYGTTTAENVDRFDDCILEYTPDTTTANHAAVWRFPVEMRVAPSVTTYNPFETGTAWRNLEDQTNRTVAVPGTSTTSARITATSTEQDTHGIHASATAQL